MTEEYLDSILVNLNENKPANSDSIGTAAAAIRQIKRCLVSKEAGGLIELIKDTVYHSWYDVGDIYITQKDDNPAVKFGGTWEKIEGKILLSSGNVPSNLPIPSDAFSDWEGLYKYNLSLTNTNEFYDGYPDITSQGKNTIIGISVGSLNSGMIFNYDATYKDLYFSGRCFKREGSTIKIEGALTLLTLVNQSSLSVDISITDGSTSTSNSLQHITTLTLNQGVKKDFSVELNLDTLPDIYYLMFRTNLNTTMSISTDTATFYPIQLEVSTNVTYDNTTYIRNGDEGSLLLPYLGCNMWRKLAN